MPSPNYAFEKRQRELAKKKDKDAKRSKKQATREQARPGTPATPAGSTDRS